MAKKSKDIVKRMEKKLKEITNGFSLEDVCYDNDGMSKQETEETKNVKEIFKAMGYTWLVYQYDMIFFLSQINHQWVLIILGSASSCNDFD